MKPVKRMDQPSDKSLHKQVNLECGCVLWLLTCLFTTLLCFEQGCVCLMQPVPMSIFCKSALAVQDVEEAAGLVEVLHLSLFESCTTFTYNCNHSLALLISSWPCGLGNWPCGWDRMPCGWDLRHYMHEWGSWPFGWDHRSYGQGSWESRILEEAPTYVAAMQNYFNQMSISVTVANGSCRSHYTAMLQHYNGKSRTIQNFVLGLSTIDAGMRTFIRQRQHWFR